MNKAKSLLGLVIVIVIIFLGISYINRDNKAEKTENQPAQTSEQTSQTIPAVATDNKIVTYNGQEGKTALDLLKQSAQIESKDSSMGVFVESVNGIKNSDKEFWTFNVNGKPAEVGADKYVTKDSDVIEWKYQGF